MITLRNYQQPFYNGIIDKVENQLSKSKLASVCAYLPTGGGKSVVIGKLVNEYLKNKGRTLLLTHRIEIFQQNSEWINEVGLLSSKTNTLRYDSKVVVAMVQTLDARIKSYGISYAGQFDNIVLDEVHILIFEKVFSRYNYKRLIGFTGSPVVYGKKLEYEIKGETYVENYTLSKLFKDLVVGPDTEDLIKLGYLVQDYSIVLKLDDFDKLKESKSNPDGYTSKSMNEVYYNTASLNKLFEGYNKYCLGKKTMIFNSSNKVNKFIYDFLKSKNINVKMFDTSKYKEINPDTNKPYNRKQIIEWFRNERDAVLVNTNVFTTGFDVEDVECVIVNRATKSLALWIQMVGRGSRTTTKIFKDKFTVLDLGQNIYEHGLWSQKRDWKKHFFSEGPKLKKPLDLLSIWECTFCGYYNPKGSTVCKDCEKDKLIIKEEKNKSYKEGEFMVIQEAKPPSGRKIVEYCQKNNLTISEGLKIAHNKIFDLFRVYKVNAEFYRKRKKDYIDSNGFPKAGFETRVMEIFRPCYFSILSGKNKLRGSRKRSLKTEFDRLIDKIEKNLNV